ncbi:MAG TPA: PVC-type heme-binding CxxCH protein [Verrucomicrobiales bacterium]|nr:PVC-type heme-binding CxxCH protein [Verrucomicrobiales bacterium]
MIALRLPGIAGLGCVALSLVIALPLQSAAQWVEWRVDPRAAGELPDGPAWFRAWLKVPDALVDPAQSDLWRDSMTLTLQDLPGSVAVFLNGKTIIETRDVPAEEPRRFKAPKGILEKGVYNALVIRTDGGGSGSGLTLAPVFAGYFDEIILSRPWEFRRDAPAEEEFVASAEIPGTAVYTEIDFRPATTVLQANPEPERGRYVSPEDALRQLQTEDDLLIEELLREPETAQPAHLSFDERGRMWVAQFRQYPYPAGVRMISRDKYYRSHYDRIPQPPPAHDPGADIVSVHEDRDGDGIYETHRQVLTGLNMANAVLRGRGGLWIMHTPFLLFYPDADGDDVPDGPPEARLQGFGLEDSHSLANGLAWGPDGWLYGAQGSTTTSRVTRPGIDPDDAPGHYVEGCMVWRYHPERRLYEIFADGGGNTFGVSFDSEGRLFTGHNGGDTRGWHHVQEGLYLKQGKDPGKFGPPANPYAFGELQMMRSPHPVPRFTHMIVLAEGTALPRRWRGRFFAIDPLHHCVVAAERVRAGSTFETTDLGFPLRSDDATFRPVYLANAPDGSVVIADFREEHIAHGQHYQSQIDPSTGRVYRLRGREQPLERDVDLSNKRVEELVALLTHSNLWHRQTAVRLLGERGDPAAAPLLQAALREDGAHPALEALWALHQLGQLDETTALQSLRHPAPMVRAWTVRLLGDARRLPEGFAAALQSAAAAESEAEVRCQILSTARRLPAAQALPLARILGERSADSDDAFIPLMGWFVLESHCAAEREEVLKLWDQPAFRTAPLVRRHWTPRLMRRFAASGTRQELLACAQLLDTAPNEEDRRALLEGFEEAFRGRALPPLPEELAQALAASGRLTLALRVRQGEAAAAAEALELIGDPAAETGARVAAVRVFGEIRHPAAVPVLLAAVQGEGPEELRGAACGALQIYDDPVIAERLLANWPESPGAARESVLHLLASRPAWSLKLLEAVAAGRVARDALSAGLLDRLRQHRQENVAALIAAEFPLQPAAAATAEVRARIEEVRRIVASGPGDPYRGEPLFAERCGACHTLFFKGGRIGPGLTGYQRDDLETMLLSIVDPDSEIREGYENIVVSTVDGRTLAGFLADEDAAVVVLRGLDGADSVLRREDIASLTPAGRSLMPPGLLDGLTDAEIRDFFAYLRQSQPITR